MGEQTKRKDVQWIRKGEKERIKKERGSKHERMRENRIQIEREKERERERDKGERETKKRDFLGIPKVEARRSEKKSRSTHRELSVGTKILEFHQTPRGREFSYLDYF